MTRHIPQIGHWYQDSDSGLLFEIVALDRDEGTVQVQYVDGELADYDLDSWADMQLRSAAAPEDWRSAFELDEDEQLDAALRPTQWGSPLSRIEPETMLGVDDY